MRWPAVAALRAAPQVRNALLKFYFFISDYIFSLHISCFSSTTGSLSHLNVHHLQQQYKKEKKKNMFNHIFVTGQKGEHQLL